jgi:hypothetical protein
MPGDGVTDESQPRHVVSNISGMALDLADKLFADNRFRFLWRHDLGVFQAGK